MASRKSRTTHNNTYMYDNLVRIRQTNMVESTEDYEENNREVSPQIKKNQRRAMKLGLGYITFFAGAVAVALFVCFQYLGIQAELTQKAREIKSLQTEITSLREKNLSEYNYITNLVNLDEIRDRAGDLGMIYADDSQIVKYESTGDQEIKQYENIPKDGTVADK